MTFHDKWDLWFFATKNHCPSNGPPFPVSIPSQIGQSIDHRLSLTLLCPCNIVPDRSRSTWVSHPFRCASDWNHPRRLDVWCSAAIYHRLEVLICHGSANRLVGTKIGEKINYFSYRAIMIDRPHLHRSTIWNSDSKMKFFDLNIFFARVAGKQGRP